MLKYKGKDIISGYSKWFGVDKICAVNELKMLGVSISAERENQIRSSCQQKKKKGPRIRRDSKGEYIRENYFINGKQKYQKIYVIDGIPAEEYWERYADPIALLQNEDYDLLYERELN